MERQSVLTIMIITTLIIQSIVISNSDENTILSIVNLPVSSERMYTTSIIMEPYALHNITFGMNVTNSAITNSIIIIKIESDENSLFIDCYGDRPTLNITWTPYTNNYVVKISNNGPYNTVLVNLTITQIGPPSSPVYFPHGFPSVSIIEIFSITLGPLILLAVLLIFYKRRRYH